MMIAFAASSQNVEQDDMYFRSKDRKVLAASKPLTMNVSSRASEVNSPINPTDSYSARNVNPEYISQAKVNPSKATQTGTTYFVPNYTPTSVNQNIYNNPANWNYYGGGYRPSYYGMNSMMGYGMNPMMMMGNGMSSFGNPYYSPMGYYDPFGYNAYGYNGFYNYGGGFGYSPGLSFSMGMGYGGFNNYWGNSFYNNYGWGGGYNSFYGGGWNRPTVIIVTNGDSNGQVVYGKRTSRSSDLDNTATSRNRSASINSSQTGNRSSSNGRVTSASDNNAGSYYQRGWRTNPETNTRASWSNSGNTSNNSNSFNNNNGNSRSGSNSDFFNNHTRSSWSGGNNNNVSIGGSRSSVGPTGGGSSSSGGGAKRGRD